MPDLIVTRGLPASGKSTWSKSWVSLDPDNRVRVNRDSLRHMMFNAYWGEGVNEDAVSVAEEAIVRESLKKGKSVVIDATHMRAAYIKKWAKIQPVTIKEFTAPLSVLEIRDAMRIQDGKRGVGPGVISRLAKRFHVKEDGTLPPIDIKEVYPPAFTPAPAWDPNKDSAIIVDIDGTLANHEPHRGPYDTSLYHLDTVHDDIRGAVNLMAGTHYVVVTSGRSEDFRAVTEKWLTDNFIQFDELVMRPSGDTRNDAIVKHELFHEHIAPRYNIALVFDDRNRVVDMWREIGLTCVQVRPGNF